MTTIGDDTTPGPVTTVDSANFVGSSPQAPRDVGLVGPADFGASASQGSGSPDTVYYIVNTGQAEELFGDNAMLTEQCRLALSNTGKPVYAVAPSEVTVSGESLGTTASPTFSNAPHPEHTDHYYITVDGNEVSPFISYDLGSATPGSSEIAINPVSGEGKLDTAPSTSSTADYTYLDYTSAISALRQEAGSVLDFIASVQENEDVGADIESAVNTMESDYEFAIGLIGTPTTIDTSTYTPTYDNSRMQMYYPTRDKNGDPLIGAVAGRRASLSLATSAIRMTVDGTTRLYHRLDGAQTANLLNARINPIQYQAGGTRVIDDLTTVTASNADESGYDTGFARLVMDEVILTTVLNEEEFIGSLNTQSTRNALGSMLRTRMRKLQESESIENFEVNVTERDARSANVRIAVETVKGLRNIYNNITAGYRTDQQSTQEEEEQQDAQSNTETDTSN